MVFFQLRFYRNNFIEHVSRPLQKGAGFGSWHSHEYHFWIPTPVGILTDEEKKEKIESIKHLAPQWLLNMPDDYWEKERLPRLLERTVENIAEIVNKEDRKKVWETWLLIGGTMPSYDIIAAKLLEFTEQSSRTLIDIVKNHPDDVDFNLVFEVENYKYMKKTTLYILCGLPFSGKTVLTKQMVERLGFKEINIDDIKFAHGYEWTDDDHVPDEEWKKIFDESYKKTLDYLTHGHDVIYDCANQDKASRERLREIAAQGDFATKVIHLNEPVELIKERWEKNKITKERFDLPESILQAAIDTYEPPTQEENVISYNHSLNIGKWFWTNFLKPPGLPSSIEITKYDSADNQAVKDLVLSSLKVFGFEYNPQYDYDLDDPQKYYIDKGGMFYVLKVDGKVIGTVAIINKENHVAELKRLYVHKDYQGSGFGSNLLDKAITFCKENGFTKLEFETNKRFTKAHTLYKKRGFNIVRKDEASYYMEKDL